MIPFSLNPFVVKSALIYYKYISFVCCSLQVFPMVTVYSLLWHLSVTYHVGYCLIKTPQALPCYYLGFIIYHHARQTIWLSAVQKKWNLFYQNWQNFLRYVILRLFRAKYNLYLSMGFWMLPAFESLFHYPYVHFIMYNHFNF